LAAAGSNMNVYEIDPTTDERWEGFLQSHSQASIFHTRGWLEALRKTYGYTPVAFTTSPPGSPLTSGIPFCRINGFFGKQRLVSLPFSDHCEPLVESNKQLNCALAHLQQKCDLEKWNYIEVRPRTTAVAATNGFGQNQSFFFHQLDLRRNLDEILQSTHKDCIQRKLRRAQREGLVYDEGTSDLLLRQFYRMLVITRRRHGAPTQPIEWFRNLIAFLGDTVKIRLASKGGQPIAGIVTLYYKKLLVYKYGCSDKRFNKLGGTQFLFWKAIQDAKEAQLSQFDMGRSDCDNSGLVTFKDRWGAARTELAYLRYPTRRSKSVSPARQAPISRYVWSHAPGCVLATAGKVLYKYGG
jgi:lipid II:glycine glycyltransferase (peptidoglycan interpeptide bridge formation enzyme)